MFPPNVGLVMSSICFSSVDIKVRAICREAGFNSCCYDTRQVSAYRGSADKHYFGLDKLTRCVQCLSIWCRKVFLEQRMIDNMDIMATIGYRLRAI